MQLNRYSMLEKIISGGQLGADIAGLRAAKALGLATGGTAPVGFRNSSGAQNSALAVQYGLQECEGAQDLPIPAQYVMRSKANVDNSDGTVAFRSCASNGTDKTIHYCRTGKWPTGVHVKPTTKPYKPVLVIDLIGNSSNRQADAQRLVDFISANNIKTLNVCGNRRILLVPNWEGIIKEFLLFALQPQATTKATGNE